VGGVSIAGVATTDKIYQFECYSNKNDVEYYTDDIEVYYKKPDCTVTFVGGNGLPESIKVLKGGNFVASEYVPTVKEKDVDAEFLGWSLVEGGTEYIDDVTVINADTTLYACFSQPTKEYTVETTGEYGRLAYYLDFDVDGAVAKVMGTGTPISDFTSLSVPALDGMPAQVRLECYSGATAYTDGDNLVMEKGNYPRWWLASYDENGTFTGGEGAFPEGTYTVEWCGKSAVTPNVLAISGYDSTLWVTNNLGEVDNSTANRFTKEYKTFVGSFTYKDGKATKANGNAVADGQTKSTDLSSGLSRIGLYSGSSGNGDIPRYYKWVKVWYAPSMVNLSFDANGKDVQVPETAYVDASVTLANYTLSDVGTSRFAGWSETPDGEIITDAAYICYGDTTLYAIWDDHYYAGEEEAEAGELAISFNYNNMGISNHHSNIWSYGTTEGTNMGKILFGGSKPSSGPWFQQGDKNPDGSFVYGFKYGEYGVTGSYKHPDNAFVIDQKIADGATKFPKLFLPASGYPLKDGVYSIFAEVCVTQSDNVTVVGDAFARVKLEGAEDYGDRAVVSKALALDGKKYYLKRTFYVKDGCYGSHEDGNMYKIVDGAKSQIGFNFAVHPVDKEKEASVRIECDNFKIYYKEYDYSPKSYTENSIRIEGVSGIRFKSSVSTVERNNENLTEYGFIVTLKDLLGDTDVNEFNHTTDVTKVEGKNYDTANNVDKIFEQNGNNFFFTAVVYNIPAGQYDTDLVVRPYTVVDGEYVYGDAMVNNIKAVAQKLVGSERYNEDESFKAAVDKFVANEAV